MVRECRTPTKEPSRSTGNPTAAKAVSELDELVKAYAEMSQGQKSNMAEVPTPEQIIERAAEIRAAWTEEQELLRRVGPKNRQMPVAGYRLDRELVNGDRMIGN